MSAARRVLMVSWLFPPHASIGAKRAYRFARHLPPAAWLPTVLCRRSPPAAWHDGSDWPLPPEVRVVAEYDSPLFAALATRGARAVVPVAVTPGGPAPGLARTRWQRVRDGLDRFIDAAVPTETAVLHAPHAARVIRALAPAHDVIWSTSYPYHSHLLGMRAAGVAGKPFVADLRDPWSPNWVHRAKFPHARWVERRCERAVFDAADAVVVTTEALAELYRSMFPAHARKFVAIHNAFDPGVPSDAAVARSERRGRPLALVHFGNVYGPWSLGTVLRALAGLRAEGLAPAGAVCLENYGRLSDADRALAARLGVDDLVRVLPPMAYTQGLARLAAADLLVLAAWSAPEARLYIQGKLYDYLLAGRDVLAETDNPEVAGIVTRTGAGAVVAPGDVAATAAVLRAVLAGRGVGARRDPAAVEFFSAPAAARRLGALLDRVADGRRP